MAKQRVAVDDRPLFIIGVDPGKMTGVSAYANGKLHMHKELPADEVTEYLSLKVLPALHDMRVVIGVERYTFGVGATRKSRQLDPVKLTGQLEDVARRYAAEFVLINQADSKRMAPDRVLRLIGWYVRTAEGHANDASRVVYTTLAQVNLTEFTKLVESVIE